MRKLSKVYTPSSEDLVRAEVVRLRLLKIATTGAKAVRSDGRSSRAGLWQSPGRGPTRLGEPSTWRPTSAHSTALRRLGWGSPLRGIRLGWGSPFHSILPPKSLSLT
ncbi:CDT1-like protein a, chloroplastic [Iris pallida]|uniref:CDT1-like protein a, chloroplastic n=1 Tax=Iris pallida TaxID=29817 RepID=A0AAX6I9N2_IRIPA|nr:CDT1-like protein a, chloroplastic [Iris pallida]